MSRKRPALLVMRVTLERRTGPLEGTTEMCFFLITLFLGPRSAIFFWWLLFPRRWETAFDSPVLPVIGFILFPWVTLAFVIVAPTGNVSDSDWVWLALAALLDLMSGGFLGMGRRRLAFS